MPGPKSAEVFTREARPAVAVVGLTLAGIVTVVSATGAALTYLGVIGRNEAHAAAAAPEKAAQQPPAGPEATLYQIAADVRDLKTGQQEQGRALQQQGLDIAVIKRQLGLDGLGPGVAAPTSYVPRNSVQAPSAAGH